MRFKSAHWSAAATTALAVAAHAAPAWAQEASGTKARQEALDEIIVTAQKREQNLQDIPVAVTALSGDALTERNVTTVSDLPRLAPSLTITQGNVPTNNSINLRGIGTFAFSTGIEPSVAVVVDDVALLQQAQAFSGLSDVSRIEVLRGPQGTLFGKNASAGVINIVSKGPTDRLSGSGTVTATTDEEYRVDASVSGPLGEKAGFRINGFYGDREGHIRNLHNGQQLNGDESHGVRGRLELRPLDLLTVDLIASRSVTQSNGAARPFRDVPDGATIFGTPVAPSLADITPGPDNHSLRANGPFFNKSQQNSYTGRATLDLGDVNLVSITSYQDWRFRFAEDFDTIERPVLGLADGILAFSSFHARLLTQEVRLVSTGSGPFEYVVGFFYSDGETDRSFDRQPDGPVRALWRSSSGTTTYATFAQATYDLGPATHIDAGIRFNHEKVDASFLNENVPVTPPADNATCLSACAGEAEDDQVTYKVALRRDLTDSVMAYASYATGYKGQGFDISTGFTPRRAAEPVRPETSDAYEIGLKSRFLDNRMQLNIAAFWTDFDGFQAQSGVLLPDNTVQLVLNNVGKVRTRGVEVEFLARPIDALQIDGAVTYADADIIEFPNAQCFAFQTPEEGCIDPDGPGPLPSLQDLSGGRLPNAPKVKYNLGARYDIDLPGLPFNGFVQADYSYQSGVNFSLLGGEFSVERGYGVVNASIGIVEDAEDGLRVTLFVQNLLDEHFAQFVGGLSGGSDGLTQQNLSRNARRYGGLRVGYSF